MKLPEDPRPVPAGMSAMLQISKPELGIPVSCIAVRMIGCWISSMELTRSSFEYLMISSGKKVS